MRPKNKNIMPLEEVLAYENEDVIYSFTEKYDIAYEEAYSIFTETKKWLWACYYRKKDPKYSDIHMSIDDSILIIDKMWHNFILFTQPYHEFCYKYFSQFLNHKPTTYRDKQRLEKSLNENRDEVLNKEIERRQKQLSYLYDILGEETIKKWYIDYSSQYTRKTILTLRKE